MKRLSIVSCLLLVAPSAICAYELPLKNRRSFLATTTNSAVVGAALLSGSPVWASSNIKVTPVAHTFITSSGTAKPIRENDATRICTNAKVVYLLLGQNANPGLAGEILDLTCKRKAGEGPGVTPGKVRLLSSDKSLTGAFATGTGVDVVSVKSESIDVVVAQAQGMAEGDVLVVGPISSNGVAADGKLLSDTAKGLGTFVGGKTGRGVISVLLDGPRVDVEFEERGYPVSELLWFSV
jgi:hypothetical protein